MKRFNPSFFLGLVAVCASSSAFAEFDPIPGRGLPPPPPGPTIVVRDIDTTICNVVPKFDDQKDVYDDGTGFVIDYSYKVRTGVLVIAVDNNGREVVAKETVREEIKKRSVRMAYANNEVKGQRRMQVVAQFSYFVSRLEALACKE